MTRLGVRTHSPARSYDATVPCLTHGLSMSANQYARPGAWMKQRGLIEQTPGGDVCWTNALAL